MRSFAGFAQSLQANAMIVALLGYECFLPCPFEFIIIICHPAIWCYTVLFLKESLNSLQKRRIKVCKLAWAFGFRHCVQMSWPFILTVSAYFLSLRKTSVQLCVLPFDQLSQGFYEYWRPPKPHPS